MFRKPLIVLGAIAVLGCGFLKSEDSDDAPPVAPTGAGSPAAALVESTPLTIGGAPQGVSISSYPGGTFAVETAGEYTIDVMGEGNFDPKSFLYREESKIAEDDDGGEGRNDRIHAFLSPGTYSLRVVGYGGAKGSVRVTIQPATPIPSAGTVEIGGSLNVTSRDADNERDACVAVTFNVADAGRYTVDVTGEEDAYAYLIKAHELLEENDDGPGDGNGSQISMMLTPGEHEIRVRHYGNDAHPFVVRVTKQ